MIRNKPLCGPLDCFETSLLLHEALHQAVQIHFCSPPRVCDMCGESFDNRRFMVDCRLAENNGPWGCICAKCFHAYGLEIGWGKGQLYTHMKNGAWLLTAGYESQDMHMKMKGSWGSEPGVQGRGSEPRSIEFDQAK